MAASEPPPEPFWKHDVFVSFRGGDTRKGFASHLFNALKQADIRCYRDVDRDERGQVVGPMLLNAIHHARVAIVLFSTNYADSKWCLKELVEILDCKKKYERFGHMVIPIFYNVEPSEVRRQSGKFGKAFKKSEAKDKEERRAWKAALKEAGNISSWHLNNDARDEAEFIEYIVDDLLNRAFYFRSTYFTSNAVGLDDNEKSLISLLNVESDDDAIHVIGIHGTEGIGKTAIAKALCRHLYNKFDGISLLGDIRRADDESKLVDLQKQLLRNVLKIKHVELSDRRNLNIAEIRNRLYRKKILLVLDDLDNKEQAYSVTGEHDFLGPGSRILITTRDEKLLDELRVDGKFMVPGLNPEHSLSLFCHHAFAQPNPRPSYEELAGHLVHYAGGVPLAIETFASFLSGRMRNDWYQMLEKLVRNPRLDPLGVYLGSVSPLYPYKIVGPFGGSGYPFDDRTHTTVRKVILVVGSVIQTILIEYDHDGALVRSAAHGGLHSATKGKPIMVALDYPNDEFLVSLSGYIAEDYGFRVIRSLRIHSNKRMYGPFGEETGTYFTFPPIDNGRIVGFFGNYDTSFVDSIGAYYGPISDPSPSYSIRSTGSTEGETWDDRKHMDIRQIDIVSSSVIESVSVTYDNYGHLLGPFTHGRVADGEKRTVKLDYPYEYLTSISGYRDKVSDKTVVRSLTFHSNRRNYGPFGPEIGMHFPAQWSGGKIVGFAGTIDDSLLESIRAHLEPVSHTHPLKDAGPFGGERGRKWDDGRHGSLRQIVITWERFVNSIKFVYETDGKAMEGPIHGGGGGSNQFTIDFDYPNEYLSTMSGYYSEVDGNTVIIALRFHSNMRMYGPYGGERGEDIAFFRTPLNIGMISGFYGRSSSFLNAIGVHFVPVYHEVPLMAIGPFGDDSRYQWDDKKHSGIRQINITFSQIVESIGCVYDDNGEAVQGRNHGGKGDVPFVIVLDDPGEYLKSISGHIGSLGSYMCIRSLTLKTNKRTFGPFGSENGTSFSFESNDCKIVGFLGSSSSHLHSIGVHVKKLLSEDSEHVTVD